MICFAESSTWAVAWSSDSGCSFESVPDAPTLLINRKPAPKANDTIRATNTNATDRDERCHSSLLLFIDPQVTALGPNLLD